MQLVEIPVKQRNRAVPHLFIAGHYPVHPAQESFEFRHRIELVESLADVCGDVGFRQSVDRLLELLEVGKLPGPLEHVEEVLCVDAQRRAQKLVRAARQPFQLDS